MKKFLNLMLITSFATALTGCYNQVKLNYQEIESYSDFQIEQSRIEYALYKAKSEDILNSSKHCITELTVFTKETPDAIEKCMEFGYISNGVAYKGKDGYTLTFLASQLKTTSEKGKK